MNKPFILYRIYGIMDNMKRYQIFISSPFKNMQEVRTRIVEEILRMGHIPVGMELFGASDNSPWEYIRPIIEESDYFILILRGNYGSKVPGETISYTHKEYLYAKQQNIPILAFHYENPENLPEKDCDLTDLLAFVQELKSFHLVSDWKSTNDLLPKIISSLNQSIVTNPRCGWVRMESNLQISPSIVCGIVSEYHHGDSWYEVFSNGKIRQGCVFTASLNQLRHITFLYPFQQNSYNVQLQNLSNADVAIKIQQQTTTYMTLRIDSHKSLGKEISISLVVEGF